MKSYITLASLVVLIFAGCSNEGTEETNNLDIKDVEEARSEEPDLAFPIELARFEVGEELRFEEILFDFDEATFVNGYFKDSFLEEDVGDEELDFIGFEVDASGFEESGNDIHFESDQFELTINNDESYPLRDGFNSMPVIRGNEEVVLYFDVTDFIESNEYEEIVTIKLHIEAPIDPKTDERIGKDASVEIEV
ncbi:hypothetical protein J2Z83_002421 [Virgibacillus natechei]|uniref:Uncharacterized protein n=1 Tax=Virgibacillus natechei TaxID=1216297 RepID=A0ABS4IH69_9BACI|nr:hypothetical protein [Virgibacillus natechei]MBP1970303.1 hypothetical protein [Virgibacillus natechei]UZD13130.1 hypothetical protein OLD84_00700 [Virgibacillus natechei]